MKSSGVLYIILLLTLFSGCVKENSRTSSEIVFQSIVSARDVASETDKPLSTGSETGLFAEYNDGHFAENLRYISQDGRMTAASADQQIVFQPGREQATVYAYSPYTASGYQYNAIDIPIANDQNTYGTISSDILWGSTTISKQSGANTLKLKHLRSLIRINILSKGGKELSNVKVELPDKYYSFQLDPRSGKIAYAGYDKTTIRAKQVSDSYFEAIMNPETVLQGTPFIRVSVRSKIYTYTLPKDKAFEAGKEYIFDVTLKDDVPVPLDCDITVKYDNSTLGNTLSLPAVVTNKGLELTANPIVANYFSLRNESGEYCWAHIWRDYDNAESLANGDRFFVLRFDENLGEERSMTMEFYDRNKPNAVYKQVVVTQSAATNYLTLSATSMNTDRLGNVYDIPYELDVKSNLAWSIESSDSWIHPQYTPGNKNQLVGITVDTNNTGVARSGKLRFIAGGNTDKTFQISQSATENNTFTLKYELNFELTTVGDWFNHQKPYYPDHMEIFNYYPSEYGDLTAKISSNEPYGFLVDAPATYNKIIVRNFKNDKLFTCRNYAGRATTIQDVNITVANERMKYPFFRSFRIDIPIPAGVKRNQKVVYYMKIHDTEHFLSYPTPEVSTEIVNQ